MKKSVSNNNLLKLNIFIFTHCPGPSCWHMVDDGIYSISLSGTRQSPINIETAASVLETDETLEELQHEYQVSCISLLLVTINMTLLDRDLHRSRQHGGQLEGGHHP